MSRSNRRREDESKPVRRRHGDRDRKLRPDDPLAKAVRGRSDADSAHKDTEDSDDEDETVGPGDDGAGVRR